MATHLLVLQVRAADGASPVVALANAVEREEALGLVRELRGAGPEEALWAIRSEIWWSRSSGKWLWWLARSGSEERWEEAAGSREGIPRGFGGVAAGWDKGPNF